MADPYRRIIDNYRHPRNSGTLRDADITARGTNPVCGDEVEIQIKLDSGRIRDIRFSGMSCATTTASASMLTEFVKGKSLGEVEMLEREDIIKLMGIKLNRDKLRCALLPLSAIKSGIRDYMQSTQGHTASRQ